MSGHTPGPWRVVDSTMHICADTPKGQAELAVVYAECEYVARLPYKANARLMAAAPDLLEAARHAAMEWRLHGQLTDSCRVLEAAIAKAEGKS